MTDKNRQSDELQIFHDVAKALTSSLDLDTILQTILEKIAAYFKPDTWSLLMLDEQTQELYYTVAVGKGCDSVNALKLAQRREPGPLGDGARRTSGYLRCEPGHQNRSRHASDDFFLETAVPWCAFRCVPAARCWAVMELVNTDMQIYSRGEMLLQALADYAAIAIENARAVQRIQELSITDDCTGRLQLAPSVHCAGGGSAAVGTVWLRVQRAVSGPGPLQDASMTRTAT